jgi:hypothetical protein
MDGCQNSQNTYFFREKKMRINCKDLDVGQNLTKFTKIPTNKKMGILGIFIMFNGKS